MCVREYVSLCECVFVCLIDSEHTRFYSHHCLCVCLCVCVSVLKFLCFGWFVQTPAALFWSGVVCVGQCGFVCCVCVCVCVLEWCFCVCNACIKV